MQLSPEEFDRQFKAETLRLAFIGMSNIGKSYTAQRLRKSHGFALYEVDEAIQHALGLRTMQESADWMGFPYDPDYSEKEAHYLQLEGKLTLAAFSQKPGNLIIDTTGSVIYAHSEELSALKAQAVIVHIQAAEENLQRLETLYLNMPKPLIWAGEYKPIDGEAQQNALKRCYPKLLASRMERYNALADVNLPASLLFEDSTTPESLIDFIRAGGKPS